MENHFNIFTQVPPERVVSDNEIVRRFSVLDPEITPWLPLSVEALASAG
ncbi:MAG: hypothetical protein ACLFRP_00380 [Puniceicoccaceae bacterium]